MAGGITGSFGFLLSQDFNGSEIPFPSYGKPTAILCVLNMVYGVYGGSTQHAGVLLTPHLLALSDLVCDVPFYPQFPWQAHHSTAHREPPNGNIHVAGSRREIGGRRLHYCFHRKEQASYLVRGSFEQFQRSLGHRDILVF